MDNYTNTHLIGEGSFSKVYQTHNKKTNTKCVLKVINVQEELDFKNILTEIHILTKNKTKYLVSSNDVFFDKSKKSIVIEIYFTEGDLADKIRLMLIIMIIFLSLGSIFPSLLPFATWQ